MSDSSLFFSEEPLEAWETEQSRWESRYGWRPGFERRVIYANVPSELKAVLYEVGDIQQLTALAAKQLAEALAVRRASLRQIAELQEQIATLRAALQEETAGTRVRPEWKSDLERELIALAASEDVECGVLELAAKFVELLGSWVPRPEVGVDPDGHVFLEWQSSARWVFTVSVSPEGMAYYSGLFGTSRNHGVDEITHVLPPSIRANLARFVAGES